MFFEDGIANSLQLDRDVACMHHNLCTSSNYFRSAQRSIVCHDKKHGRLFSMTVVYVVEKVYAAVKVRSQALFRYS